MTPTMALEHVRHACDRLGLPIDQDEAVVVSALLTAYAPALAAIREYSVEEGRGYDERAIAFTPPPDARALPSLGDAAPANPDRARTHAARAIALIGERAVPTNAFIRTADPPLSVPSGPLNGINFAVKDCILVAGEPTTAGSSFAGA